MLKLVVLGDGKHNLTFTSGHVSVNLFTKSATSVVCRACADQASISKL